MRLEKRPGPGSAGDAATQRAVGWFRLAVGGLVVWASVLGAVARAQTGGASLPPAGAAGNPASAAAGTAQAGATASEAAKSEAAGEQAKVRVVSAKQMQLEADTARLVQLTAQLNAEMAKTTKDTMSLKVIQTADEIEKLAKSLKDRTRQP